MKIDLVYLWVDINDPVYIERNRNFIQNNLSQSYRYRQVDELKYSLRSIHKHLPWINNIYIITDGQHPTWLNINHPKIHIVDHSHIFPVDVKHCFNSNAIEACITNIANLSSHFLYANDDMFVNKNLSPNYFFNEKNRPIFKIVRLPYVSNNLYNLVIHNANVAALGKHSKFFFKVPSHNICPYVKKDYHDTVYNSQFTNNFNATIKNRYRTAYDVSRFLIANHLWKGNKAEMRKTHFNQELYCTARNLWLVRLLRPKLFCVNDSSWIKPKHNEKLRKWLDRKFNEKAPWENN